MEITKGFYDLCVPYDPNKTQMKAVFNELINLGYKTIALEEMFDCSKKDKKSGEIFPEPTDLDYLADFSDRLKILRRLTISYSNDQLLTLQMNNSLNINKFNIIAGLPSTDAAMNHCCTTFQGDIICINMQISRKLYKVAVGRKMYFELRYSPAIVDSTERKKYIRLAQYYHIRGKSKNILISSGAKNKFELRGPYDIANLALIFGLSEEQGKSSISSLGRLACLRAESRRIGKTIMFINNTPTVLSSSTESENDDDEDDSMNDENLGAIKSVGDESDKMEMFHEDDDAEQRPHKKKKLN